MNYELISLLVFIVGAVWTIAMTKQWLKRVKTPEWLNLLRNYKEQEVFASVPLFVVSLTLVIGGGAFIPVAAHSERLTAEYEARQYSGRYDEQLKKLVHDMTGGYYVRPGGMMLRFYSDGLRRGGYICEVYVVAGNGRDVLVIHPVWRDSESERMDLPVDSRGRFGQAKYGPPSRWYLLLTEDIVSKNGLNENEVTFGGESFLCE